MIVINTRFGIGFDIEHNENICHVVEDSEGRFVAGFQGLIVKVPFLSLYWGEFEELDEEVLS